MNMKEYRFKIPPMRTSVRRSRRDLLIFLAVLLSLAAIGVIVICVRG